MSTTYTGNITEIRPLLRGEKPRVLLNLEVKIPNPKVPSGETLARVTTSMSLASLKAVTFTQDTLCRIYGKNTLSDILTAADALSDLKQEVKVTKRVDGQYENWDVHPTSNNASEQEVADLLARLEQQEQETSDVPEDEDDLPPF